MLERADNVREAGPAALDVEAVRRDFPILQTKMNGRPLVFLDNAATTQKPRAVIDAITRYYESQNANIHRGVYALSQLATNLFDTAREKVATFLNAPEAAECLFVRGVTEAINLVAHAWARHNLNAGDEVLVGALEHHSNIVPWQLACEATGARLRVFPMNDRGELEMERLGEFVTDRTRLVSIQHVSNALGTVHDVEAITAAAKERGAVVFVDGAQHVGHFPTDVRRIGCDFYAFSGHKLFGPTGVGVLWGRREILETMPPFLGGGDMIESVTWEKTTYAPIPAKFEAGTPDIAGVIGLGAAIDYLASLGWEKLVAHEHALLEHAHRRLAEVPGLRLIGTAARKAGVASFVLEDPPVAPLDVGMKLDALGIAVRTGHHCAQPLMDAFAIPGTARASFAFYNTLAEIDLLADALTEIVREAAGRRAVRPALRKVADRVGSAEPAAGDDRPWPEPKGATPAEAAQELVDTFAFLRDAGEDPRDFVLDLGRKLPPLRPQDKNEATHVKGCMSQVWLVARHSPAGTPQDPRIDILAESDAEIVKGLIAVLQHVFSGQRARDILDYDVAALMRKLNLQSLISVQRRSGVEAMINRIHSIARAAAGPPTAHK